MTRTSRRARRAALEAWVHGLTAPNPRAPVTGAVREQRREAAHHEAVLARVLDEYDAHGGEQPDAVVVLHRQEWTRRAVADAVTAEGLTVAAAHDDGASGLAAIVALRPAAVLVEQRLPWLDGLTVVRGVRALSPGTGVVVHLDGPDAGAEPEALAAGADAAVPRETPARDLAARLLALVRQPTA